MIRRVASTGKPGRLDLHFDQGSTFEREIQLLDQDGTIIDVGTHSAELEVRPYPGDTTTPLLLLQTNPAIGGAAGNARIVATSGSDSKFTLTVTAATMAALTAWLEPAVYDFVIQDAAGTRTVVLEGKATFRKRISIPG